jgi:ubiquinol-cytochrome c reductase cytochrome c1 subunit
LKILAALFLLFFTLPVFAAEIPPVVLEKPSINLNDKAAIKRGAKFFASVCMACHTLIYLRYDKLANEAGVTYEKMPVNVKWPQSAVPPDLSLETDARSVDWVYTYLHSFYVDTARPTGFNNLLLTNTMMPGIIVPFQGQQVLATDNRDSRTINHEWHYYDLLVMQSKGSMDAEQFDATVKDVVTFLAYAAEPYHAQQHKLGWKVLLYLLIFFVFAYLLKREYWKDIK